MVVHTYISNKYVLSSEEEEVLKRAASVCIQSGRGQIGKGFSGSKKRLELSSQ